MKRYQECSRVEKIWRCRWYLLAPFIFIYKLAIRVRVYEDEIRDGELVSTGKYYNASSRLIWSMVIGQLETSKMIFYYTPEEVLGNIEDDQEEE